VTWNVLHCADFPGGGDALTAVAATLRSFDADIIALQEIDRELPRSGGLHQAAELGRALDYRAVFAPSLSGSPDTRWRAIDGSDPGGPAYGVALLTRFPVGRVRRLQLPGGGDGFRSPTATPTRPGWDREPRVALSAELDVEGTSVTVTCTHLSYLPWRAVRQLGHVLAAAPGNGPAVLAGDFNLPAAILRSRAPGWQWAGGAPTHPAPAPRLQLDHVLVRQMAVEAARVAPAASSDHLALVADVRLRA
jgi:endonuclease/exonuclease/phosphatase family metal-dependent hydrolase